MADMGFMIIERKNCYDLFIIKILIMFECMSVCVCVCLYIYIYTYTHTLFQL